MQENLMLNLQDALNSLEYSRTVDKLIEVQNILRLIEDEARKIIVEYVD